MGTNGTQRHTFLYGLAAAAALVATINAINMISESRDVAGAGLLPLMIWEGSSWLTVMAFFWIPWAAYRLAPPSVRPRWRLLIHVPAALLFALGHVSGFIGLRKMAYAMVGLRYRIDGFWSNLGYELRKDVIGYTLFIIGFAFIAHLLRQQRSVAAPAAPSPRSTFAAAPVLLAAALPLATAQASAPIIQTRFTADPAPMVHEGVVYLYTSHDEDDAEGFKMLDWRLYSSTDMANWTDRGVVASLKTFPWANQTNDAWAPQVVARNGKFYLFTPVTVAGSPRNVIAVAVADTPAGPFRDALGKPLIAPGEGFFDPTVWIDKNGQAYLYWGNPDLWYVKLNRDMVSYSGPITKVRPRITDYQEGPWFYRRGGHYYMAFASTCCSEGIGYAMSDRPTGPWAYKGPIMDHDTRATGNHPGIIDYKGGSYLFGFSYELNFAVTPIHHERRSVSVAKFGYNPDGTIPNLHWWDRTSTPQIGTLNPYVRVEAETIAWTSRIRRDRDRPYVWAPGVTTAQDDRGGVYVTRTGDRSYIKVVGVDFGSDGANAFRARVANGTLGAAIELRLDRTDGPLIGTMPVGDVRAWQDKITAVSGASGVRDLYLIFRGSGAPSLVDMDYWKFDH